MLYVEIISDENQAVLLLDAHEIKFIKNDKTNPKMVTITWKDGAETTLNFGNFDGGKQFVSAVMKAIEEDYR